jgi:hypothetical protein
LVLDYDMLVNCAVDDDIRARYVTRFHRSTWNRVLDLVVNQAAATELTGLMRQFGVNPSLIVSHTHLVMVVC